MCKRKCNSSKKGKQKKRKLSRRGTFHKEADERVELYFKDTFLKRFPSRLLGEIHSFVIIECSICGEELYSPQDNWDVKHQKCYSCNFYFCGKQSCLMVENDAFTGCDEIGLHQFCEICHAKAMDTVSPEIKCDFCGTKEGAVYYDCCPICFIIQLNCHGCDKLICGDCSDISDFGAYCIDCFKNLGVQHTEYP